MSAGRIAPPGPTRSPENHPMGAWWSAIRIGREHSGLRQVLMVVRRLLALAIVAITGVALITGCGNVPPPPLVSSNVASTKPVPNQQLKQVVIGVDSVAGGYNPHTLADQSTVTTALSALLLPSVFRPGPDGSPQLDRTVAASAQVTNADPFTVSYTLRTDASWSDGVPIAAEDFSYLRDQMAAQPGVTDSTGYRLISAITARANGKVVQVTFAKPYPGWRSLFSNLLPAHLLKDAPGGWQAALHDSFPAFAGPFSVRTLDADRGEVVLERNDRYWDKPTPLDRVVLRRAAAGDLVNALRTGDDQLASFTADEAASDMLRSLIASEQGKGMTVSSVPRPQVVQLLLRPASPQLADLQVRQAVAASIDREALIAEGIRQSASALRTDSLVIAPSQIGYRPTIPSNAPAAKPDSVAAGKLLTAAGYTRSAGGWSKEHKPLRLTIAAPQGVEPYDSLAELVRQQLAASGIAATIITPPAAQLYGNLLATPPGQPSGRQGGAANGDGIGQIDIALAPRPVQGELTASLAAQFGCPQAGTTQPPNPSGFCDSAVQPIIDKALTGDLSVNEALAQLEPRLWADSVSIPLFQRVDEVAVRPEVGNFSPAPPLSGPFLGAATWRRLDR